jgi:hypothetical protein
LNPLSGGEAFHEVLPSDVVLRDNQGGEGIIPRRVNMKGRGITPSAKAMGNGIDKGSWKMECFKSVKEEKEVVIPNRISTSSRTPKDM